MTVYETKTVRIHLPDHGQYCFLMLTLFDGEDHLLGENGWGGEYVQYTIMTRNERRRDSDYDPFALIRRHGWLQDTAVERFVKDLDMDRFDWDDLEDGDKLTPDDIAALSQEADA